MASYSLPVTKRGVVRRGGGILGLIEQLLGSDPDGYEEARQANETRYLDILQLDKDSRSRVMNDLLSLGDSLRNDTNRKYDNKRNDLLSDLADRGLSGSTRRIPTELAVARERGDELRRIEDMLRENRAQAEERYNDKITGVMERREDPYPENRTNIAALVTQLLGSGLGGGGSALDDLLGSGGHRSRKGQRKMTAAAQPAVPKYGPQNGYRSAAQDAAEAERGRRAAMLALYEATSDGGLEQDDRARAALQSAIAQGYAEHNPNAGTPQVGFARTYDQPGYLPAGPAYNYSRVPLSQRDPLFAEILAKRRARSATARGGARPGATMVPMDASVYGLWSNFA